MGSTERAKQRVEAWVKAQQDEQQDQRVDQRQQPQQGGGQGNQQAQQVQQQPSPLDHMLRPEVQERFRQVLYEALHMAIPQVHQQQPSALDHMLRPEAQERFRQVLYQELHMAFPQVHQQQVIQQVIQQHQSQGQPQGQQPTYEIQRQQQQRQQAHQQQVQQQQARLLRQPPHQPQHQPQAQSKNDQEEGRTSFSTHRARYVIIRRVADSSEGTVNLARSTPKDRSSSAGELRIVKSVTSNGSNPREAHMLFAAGPHPNVLRIFESAYDQRLGMAHMCMEYCSGGDLHELQCAYGAQLVHVPDQVILKAIVDISDGLAFLHGGWVRNEKTGFYQTTLNARRIIHRDLKTTNIFIRLNGVGKLPTFVLGDFGQAFHASEAETRSHGGTAGFRAPEFERRPEVAITDKADVYSFAMTIVSVCQTLMLQSEKFKCASNPLALRLPIRLQTYRLEKLLRDCLAIEPKDRPGMSPSGVLAITRGYRAQLKSMVSYVNLLPGPRAANVGVARAA